MKSIKVLILLGIIVVPASAYPQETVHPEIGAKAPKVLLAKDILALPEREQQAWFHAAVSATIQFLSADNPDQAGCAVAWYFGDGRGKQVIPAAFERYKEEPATSIIYAAITGVCPAA